jgi:Putative zinc-finger
MHRRCGDLREALAVYVLGAIEPADRDAVDRHLAGCADCRDELAGLAGLPALLRRVSVAEATALAVGGTGRSENLPSGQVLQSMLARSSRQRRRHLRTWAAAAAAAGLVAGAGVIAGWQAARPPAPQAVGSAPAWTGASRGASQQTRASAIVRYATSRWGLRLSMQVIGVPPGTACELEVINRGGQEEAAGSWTITGRPGAWYPASAAVPLSGIRGFVLSSGSRTLVRIPVRAGNSGGGFG